MTVAAPASPARVEAPGPPPLVLWPTAPGSRRHGPQRASRAATRDACRARGVRRQEVTCDGPYGYRDRLGEAWVDPQVGRLVVVEHDVEPTAGQLRQILDCDHPACFRTYRMRAGPGEDPASQIWIHRHLESWPAGARWVGDTALVSSVGPGPVWRPGQLADVEVDGCWPLGFAAFSREARALLPPAFWALPQSWRALDTRLTFVLSRAGVLGHLHGSVTHPQRR